MISFLFFTGLVGVITFLVTRKDDHDSSSGYFLAGRSLTFPLIAFYFGRVSLVAPLANLLVLPVQPAIMAWGGAATLIGMLPILEVAARVLSWGPWLFLAYTTSVVQWMAASARTARDPRVTRVSGRVRTSASG